MHYLKFSILFFILPFCSFGQNEFSIDAYRHTTHHANYKATFQVSDAKNLKPELTKRYYWYSNNAVKVTQGAYAGKLLNGMYIASYSNGNLKEQGIFILGLKEGEWKNWDENGVLLGSKTYRKGMLNGAFNNFADGKLKESGNYKNDVLHGDMRIYGKQDSIAISKYKEGKIVEPKPKWSWFNKMLKKQKK